MKIELVVFDMAGTTVRDDDAVNICLRDAMRAAGELVTRDEVNAVMGIAKPLAIRKLLEKRSSQPVTTARVDDIHTDFFGRMTGYYQTSATVEPMPHTLDVFSQLKEEGVRIALDTGFSRPIVDAILDRLGWKDSALLDATVTSDEVPRGRPHADLILRAMALTGVKDARAVAKVGDTPADLEEGSTAACGLVIGVTNGSHTAQQLKSFPHTHLIADLSELPDIVFANLPAQPRTEPAIRG
jgi:phosphonatase-like hydrolase